MFDFPFDAVKTTAQAEHSRYVQRIRRRYPAELAAFAETAPGQPRTAEISALIDHLLAQGRELGAALRVARQLVMERLVVLDVEQGSAMLDITATMTELAEVTLDYALRAAEAEADAKHGAPLNEQGRRIDMWVVGMGKLGGRELNVSSDIDLIYVYEEDGHTAGLNDDIGIIKGRVTVHEYFTLVARRLSTLIGDTTEDGFVFRVDLALRPNGNSGPSVVSLSMLEEYFLVQGREWERFAWLKSRIIAPRRAMPGGEHHKRALDLRDIVMPFVFRRYLDYGVFEGLRQLHRKIRDEANRRAAGRPERANDVKLSRGGIREIEFTVQLLQVVRGGQFPEIRTRSTLKALPRLAARGLIPNATAKWLAQAYIFLRRIEHRIQFLDDQQTHLLPTEDRDLAWIADSLGLQGRERGTPINPDCHTGTCQLLDALCSVRELVATEFDALLHDGRGPGASGDGGCRTCGGPPLPVDSDEFLAKLPEPVCSKVREFAAQPKVAMLSDAAKLRLAKLIGRATMAAYGKDSKGLQPDASDCLGPDAVLRFIEWLNPLLRRDSYLSLLAERPEVLNRLLRLLGLAKWPMRYLLRHPGVIDELADPRLMEGRFDPVGYQKELNERHNAWTRAGQADEEALLDTLRRAHHAEIFRTLVRDVEGQLTVEQVADDLSALADATLNTIIQWAWGHLQQRPGKQGAYAVGRQPHFAVIAYGKLGGLELGYGSDLDVVFLYDDTQDQQPADAGPDTAGPIDAYLLFARKLITWLTLRTSAGELFDIDTALRPNGNSGLLVTSFHSFDDYQRQRGSNTAWTWEHQALTRARWCAGEPALAERFETTRRAVLSAERDPAALREEVTAMRERMREAHACPPAEFDIKHSPGGMIDVEFAVQFLILAYSRLHPELLDNKGNIALLDRAEQAGLLPAGVGHAAGQAYRELRRIQHRARLDDAPTRFELAQMPSLQTPRDAVLALWRAVFPSA
ncbi:MAG TPA: bifunctional [glutamate--ammonia ligase]-adenylyl-L-tyrosine phosphorylase/[glutamate--ammonia-ligase] adenylyltransferase [Aquabacterium sp.]|uniref:bifunctional [glutamate--ammonia ligase]-adenylyl-L-tyrosine phosphorylase/[glutamate--ammonia-ligase] adenylyltransferase n=1 Tax=Aquabacterium sp. TaxID=1872578 RepID=UPI002E2F3751|nr:bifunctional [glutamate--ammonia ligase]-adenylyl-L-tyrosine phosphorylase/[glutamate--ammonia-ligase] adenylyltransferase [Aquabacterium sp.]HEX5355212.1 bifunctional [glutamate--ammonia ligase]-adenylyl-L-tyrosine phosphorylase/[glutamate--ammonia-ligase] adenylyltransferase [Aquabacterium sp.]